MSPYSESIRAWCAAAVASGPPERWAAREDLFAGKLWMCPVLFPDGRRFEWRPDLEWPGYFGWDRWDKYLQKCDAEDPQRTFVTREDHAIS